MLAQVSGEASLWPFRDIFIHTFGAGWQDAINLTIIILFWYSNQAGFLPEVLRLFGSKRISGGIKNGKKNEVYINKITDFLKRIGISPFGPCC